MPVQPSSEASRFGELLLVGERISEEELEATLPLQRPVASLIKRGTCVVKDFLKALSRQSDLPKLAREGLSRAAGRSTTM